MISKYGHIFFFAFFLFLFASKAEGQTFEKIIGQPALNEGGEAVIQSPDGNLFIGGYSSDSAMIIKISPQGNIIWTKTFLPVPGAGYINGIVNFAITPDNYLIGTAFARRNAPYDLKGFYFKFDLNGNMIWCKYDTDPRPIYCTLLMPKSATEYILMGDVGDQSLSPFDDVITTRIDASTGNVISQSPRINYMAVNQYIDDIFSSTMGRNNCIYSTGRIYVNGASQQGMRPYLSKFDNNGNILFSKFLIFSSAQSALVYGEDLIYDNDSIVLAYRGSTNGTPFAYTCGLYKTDTLGNVIWAKDYDIGISPCEATDQVLRLPNGYLLIGFTNEFASATTKHLFMIATDLNGNMLWSKVYGAANMGQYPYYETPDLAIVSGNTIYVTMQQDNGTNTDVYFLATDLNGNISSCGNATPLTVTQTNDPTNSTMCNMTYITSPVPYSPFTPTAPRTFPDPCSQYHVNLGNDTSTCNPVTLNATTAGATSYQWQNGSSQPTLTANNPGTYWVNVSINCCWITDTIQISGGSGATAQFAPTVPPCGGGPVTFANSSTNATNYYWDFGDNSNDTSANPSHVYASNGTYTVTLIVSGVCGTDTTQELITINYPLTVLFNVGNAQGCGPLTVNFQDSSSVSSGNITGWLWDFGDGNTSTQQNPQHTYTIPGTYNVTLTVTSSSGCTIAFTQSGVVTVFPDPIANFSIQNSPVTSIDPTANFIDLSTGAVTWQWNFGDSTTSIIQNPHHSYQGLGNYPVTLVVTNSYGCTDTATGVVEYIDGFTFYIPNCFTPNGNGTNENFTGIGEGIEKFHMMIFDRWGMLLYETNDLYKPWDGTFKGKLVEEDVYVYKIDLTDIFHNGHNYIGHVSVVR